MPNLFIRLFFILFLCPAISSFGQGWGWAIGSSSTQFASPNKRIAIDKKGNLYIASMTMSSASVTLSNTFGPFTVIDSGNIKQQGLLVSTDSAGNYRWAIGTQFGRAWFMDIAADPADNLYVLGYSIGPFHFGNVVYSTPASFCAKVRADGSVAWVKNIPFDVNRIAVDENANIYLGGGFSTGSVVVGSTVLVNADPGTYDVVVAKYDSSFASVWATSLGGDSTEYVHAIAVANGDLYLAGSYSSTSIVVRNDTLLNTSVPQNELFVAKFSDAGAQVWGRRALSSVVSYTHDLYVDGQSNLFVAGSYGQNFSMGSYSLPYAAWNLRMYMAKYDSAGNVRFLNGISDSVFTSAENITGDDCGNVWISGHGGHSALTLSQPMYLGWYDTLGNFIDTLVLTHGGSGNGDIVLNRKGSIYITSEYNGTMEVGGTTLSIGGSGKNMFVAQYKYGDCNSAFVVKQASGDAGDVLIYPNPAAGACTFYSERGFSNIASVAVYDMTGRTMAVGYLSGKAADISVANLPAGTYLCKIFMDDGNIVLKKIIVIR